MCPTPACKIGEPCCPLSPQNGDTGQPCCDLTKYEYPCQDLDLVTQCDRTWGAGEVFPAGVGEEANKPCSIDGNRRYLVKGQSDLEGTFECIAKVGASGDELLGQALTAAVQKPINDKIRPLKDLVLVLEVLAYSAFPSRPSARAEPVTPDRSPHPRD